jgi:transposase
MVPKGSSPDEWREWRRLRALQLKQQGWRQRDIAEALDVSEETVSRWLARARAGGPEALLAHHAPGHPSKLSPAQRRLIPEFLWHGPEAYGFRGEVWTCARVAKVIEEEFGVIYHKHHVARLLRQLRWTPQVPIRRALQRDDEAIEHWRDEVWPELRKRARRERRVLVFVDESGFYLLPGVVKTYAPEGRTPILRAKLTRDHLSVMGGMTPQGKIYTLVRQESLNGLHVIEFLVHLGRVAATRLLVIWDGSPIHRRVEVQEFVSDTRGKVWLEALPGYAPDLNPWDEGGWHHLKHVEMRNLVCRDLEELHQEFHIAVGRVRRKPHLVQSFFAQAGLKIEKT